MSQSRNIDLRMNSDHFFRKAQFCFDQKDWSNAIMRFKHVIAETKKIPAHELNRDDYYLLAVSYRDMVWPCFNLDEISQALTFYRDSLTNFSRAISELSSEKFADPYYMKVLLSYRHIMTTIWRRLNQDQLSAENKAEFAATFKYMEAFFDETGNKFPQAGISKAWVKAIKKTSAASVSQQSMFNKITSEAARVEGPAIAQKHDYHLRGR